MADGGSHFDCEEVRKWAAANGVQFLTTPAYAPWTNGLAEGHVKLLIGRLKRLCAGTVGESSDNNTNAATTPEAWPKHLVQATAQLNDRVLPSLGYSPRELLTGVIRADRKAESASAIWDPRRGDVRVNMGLTYALRQDVFAAALQHANHKKRAFDKKHRHTEFKVGDLVQHYDARLNETHSSLRKLVPHLQGNVFSTAAHTCLLRPFVPRPGTTLAAYAKALQRARKLDPNATRPLAPPAPEELPRTPRPEIRTPLRRRRQIGPALADTHEHAEA
ncbi:hypothetical protein FRC09_019431, partial [Ceratobasidium sp. 395]